MDLSIVIVSHNHAAYLSGCLESVNRGRRGLASEVFVVANLRRDGSEAVARACCPDARVIVNDRPRGLAANTNAAIRSSRGRHVLLLNPDTVVGDGALGTLVEYLDANPDVGIAGPRLEGPDGQLQLSCRRFPSVRSVVARRTPLRRFLRDSSLNRQHLMADVDHDVAQPVDWMLGACLIARREAIAEVGLLDPGYYLYVEDIDWCYRMHQRGWNVMYVPSATVTHHHLAVTDARWLTWRTAAHFAGMARFVWKHRVRGGAGKRLASGESPLTTSRS